jgi:phage gp36-like protein
MPYAHEADIAELYGANALVVADHDRDGVPDHTAVLRSMEYASAEIDSYLATRHNLPLVEVPLRIKQLCVDIAIYRLALSGEMMTEEIEKRYELALSALRDLATGKANLVFTTAPGGNGPEGDFTGPSPIVTAGSERIFSRDKMRGL